MRKKQSPQAAHRPTDTYKICIFMRSGEELCWWLMLRHFRPAVIGGRMVDDSILARTTVHDQPANERWGYPWSCMWRSGCWDPELLSCWDLPDSDCYVAHAQLHTTPLRSDLTQTRKALLDECVTFFGLSQQIMEVLQLKLLISTAVGQGRWCCGLIEWSVIYWFRSESI